jgi:hypothetical protein
MQRRQGAYRYTPSTFSTHVRTNLVPVRSLALLLDSDVLKAWYTRAYSTGTVCAARESLGTNFFVAFDPLKQTPLF